ncbi:DNA ligase D [Dyella sp. Tek66A03]|uniref:DNA ligase D n=1 Tax=Dyella sp. Tek66A03 TaxID=3458298 RepID=UPI00403E7FC6
MSLKAYRNKRDFERTREPSGAPRGRSKRPIFVVQLHHARQRHFDFRLQVGNVLKSWAVPKGPSMDPSVKRLAVEVEDHPLDYADFEGDIPEGNYGAGHVECFDRGLWSTETDPQAQLRKGHLDFTLDGDRLKGHWHLVRSHRKERQPSWFLIKGKDAFAGDFEADDMLEGSSPQQHKRAPVKTKAKTPAGRKKTAAGSNSRPSPALVKRQPKETIDAGFFAPELTQWRAEVPKGDDWLHEIKWDGYRILTAVADGEVKAWSRNALPWSDRIPDVVAAVRQLGLKSARLDGELVVLVDGRSDFGALQKTLSGQAQASLTYVLFDLIHLHGHDLSALPLLERKRLLEQILERAPKGTAQHLRYSAHVVGNAEAMLDMVHTSRLEGVVSKRTASPYRPGRTGDWLKIKRLDSDEFAVVGYTTAKGQRQGFGSLLLGRPSAGGGWDFAGRVGTGFTDAQLSQIAKQLVGHVRKTPTVHAPTIDPLLRGAHWVTPNVVAEVYYRGLGGNGLLRQPSLKTLRPDKSVDDLRDADRAAPAPKAAPSSHAMPDFTSAVAITHPDRKVFPDQGITKLEVAEYYASIMDWFLPGVVERPLSVLRCPEGLVSECFFQKHLTRGLSHVGTISLKEGSGRKQAYLYPSDADSIIELVQFGSLEFHPWGATIDDPDHATQVVFDLDPGDGVAWSQIVSAAQRVRKLLAQLSLTSFVRTTGGKGLHVVLPLHPAAPWDVAKDFSRGFADTLAQMHPEQFVAVAGKAKRPGRIYIDYLRNSRGATSVASYSLRARPGAPVAVPLRWEELGRLGSGAAFDLRTTPKRLARLRGDPWEAFDATRQDLDEVAERLAKIG